MYIYHAQEVMRSTKTHKKSCKKNTKFHLNPQINSLQDSGEINVHMKFEMKINKAFRDQQHLSAPRSVNE